MMKKISLALFFAAFSLSVIAQTVKLPEPKTKGGVGLYDALSNRQSLRSFSNQSLTDQQLSDLLWCANGVNRKDGKRTAPSARNRREIDVYVLTTKGTFLYEPEKNALIPLSEKDHRANVSKRCEFTKDAPVVLVFVANYDKMDGFDEANREFYGATDCGYVSQNVYLYCAANDMATVVLGAIERDIIQEFLNVKNGKVILAQPVGFQGKK